MSQMTRETWCGKFIEPRHLNVDFFLIANFYTFIFIILIFTYFFLRQAVLIFSSHVKFLSPKLLHYLVCHSVLTSSWDIFTITYGDELLFLLILYDTSLNFYSQRHCWFAIESMKLFEVLSSTTPFTSPTKFAHSSSPSRARGENTFVLPSFRDPGEGNVLLDVRPRRGTSLPGIVQRTAAASRSHGRRGSNGQRRADISAGGSCWDAAIMFVH